jgi:CRISPR/Cas system CSM-associated protein Csm3 (group 7 of RAMP superfamily)
MNATLSEHVSKRIENARKFHRRRTATVTIQLLTPLHIGAGDEGEISDAAVVLDANGLATIPGSSIKGVLRSAFAQNTDPLSDINQIFGYQAADDKGQGARIRVTWGRVHDQHNQPVEGIVDPNRLSADKVLESASCPELRDHVNIDGRGISRNKFDDLSIAAGHRFTFRIEFVSDDSNADKQAWATLIALLRDAENNPGTLRFGGKTRRGFGAVKIASLQADPDHASANRSQTHQPLHEIPLVPDQDGYWIFGGGDDIDEKSAESDSNPVRAGKVAWHGDQGSFDPEILVIPGSSLKGPLRHRARFHLCRRMGVWAETAKPEDHKRVGVALSLLFGDVDLEEKGTKQSRQAPKDRVRVGCLFIDDVYLDGRDGAPSTPNSAEIQNHVAIDRALGGAFDHALFTDRPLHGGGFTLRIDFQDPRALCLNKRELAILGMNEDPGNAKALELFNHAKGALSDAVEDLKQGLLSLGAHGNRGYGWFRAADSTGNPSNLTHKS